MMALTSTGSAASMSASAKTICGDFATKFHGDAAIVLGGRLLDRGTQSMANR